MRSSQIVSSSIFNKTIIKCNFIPKPLSKIVCGFSANCIDSNSNIIISAYIYCKTGLVESKPKYLSVSSSQKYSVLLDIPDFIGDYESFIVIRVNPSEDVEKVVNINNLRISKAYTGHNIIYDESKIISLYPMVVKESGYAILADNVVDNITEFGYTVVDMSTDKSITHLTNISMFITLPPSFYKTSSKFDIGYTMFESTKIPQNWIENCNMMDRLFVPCKANIQSFRASGVTVPIDVVPIGVDTKLYDPELHLPTSDFGLQQFENSYKFIILNDGQPRKNNEMIFKAFNEEFKSEIISNKVFLVVRQHVPCTGSNIIYINKYLENHDLASLIQSCDCMVSASSGEAGDIPILIAMSMGKPVVVTKEFVHPDYVEDNKTGYFIETESMVPAYTDPLYKDSIGLITGAEWFYPSIISLKEKMRCVYENRDEANKVGNNAREFIIKNRDNKVCVNKMLEIFKMLEG